VFEGFTCEDIDTGEATLRVRHGGDESPVLLLHGHERCAVVRHDRDAKIALLCTLDYLEMVSPLARCDATIVAGWWRWFFLGQTARPAGIRCIPIECQI
jgi:hypothetical protein